MRRHELDEQRIKTNLKRRIDGNRKVRTAAINHKLNDRCRGAIRTKTGRALSPWAFLPYTVDELREHLERLFEPGMTWKEMELWHIDHIKPVHLFNFNTFEDIEFLECFALSNLRPVWARDNMRKGGKWIDPDINPMFPGFEPQNGQDRIGGQLNAR